MHTASPRHRLVPCASILAIACALLGCGSGSGTTDAGPGTAGAGGKAASGGAGTTGTAGALGTGGTGGTVGATGGSGAAGTAGTGGSAGSAGTAGSTGNNGGAGGAGNGGRAGSGGSGGRGGAGTGDAGTGGPAGSGGRGGAAGNGAAGAGGRGGAAGNGAAGAGGRGGAAGNGAAGAGGRGGAAGNGAAGAGGHGGGAAGTGGAQTLRIMPLGDSTTASICYRSHLWQLLTNAGHTQFNFIGTRNGDPGCSFTAYDKDNEGHGGYIVSDVLKATSTGRPSGADATDPYVSSAADLDTWFDGDPADIVLMHFGTNDVWNNIAPSKILQAYSAILAKLRSVNPNVRLLIAQITPMSPSGCTGCAAGVQTLDAMIPGWATSNSTTASPISVVDQWTGFNSTTDTVDGVHATDAGSLKIATNWFNALVPLF